MRPPENTMQPRQQQRLSLLHRLCTGQHAARKQTGSVRSTTGHNSTAAVSKHCFVCLLMG